MSGPLPKPSEALDLDDREKVRAGRPLLIWTLGGWVVLAALIWFVAHQNHWKTSSALPVGASALVGWFVTLLLSYSVRDLVLIWQDQPQIMLVAPEKRAWRGPWLPVAAVLIGLLLGYLGWK